MIPTIEWKDGIVRMLDQTKLPCEIVYIDCKDYQTVVQGIKELWVRGAPAIGVSAAMGLALGARQRDIRRQFLLEATLLSVLGGLVGVLLGVLAAAGVRGLLDFPARVTPGIVALGILLSAVVGMVAGYWPARNASRLPVVDALRAE